LRAASDASAKAIAGCGVDAVPSTAVNLFDKAAAPVVTRRVAFDTLWVYGGASDTTMLNGDRVAAFPGATLRSLIWRVAGFIGWEPMESCGRGDQEARGRETSTTCGTWT